MSIAEIKARLEAAKYDDTTSYCVEKYEPPNESPVFTQICIKTRAIELYHHAPQDIARLIRALELAIEQRDGYINQYALDFAVNYIPNDNAAIDKILEGDK